MPDLTPGPTFPERVFAAVRGIASRAVRRAVASAAIRLGRVPDDSTVGRLREMALSNGSTIYFDDDTPLEGLRDPPGWNPGTDDGATDPEPGSVSYAAYIVRHTPRFTRVAEDGPVELYFDRQSGGLLRIDDGVVTSLGAFNHADDVGLGGDYLGD